MLSEAVVDCQLDQGAVNGFAYLWLCQSAVMSVWSRYVGLHTTEQIMRISWICKVFIRWPRRVHIRRATTMSETEKKTQV